MLGVLVRGSGAGGAGMGRCRRGMEGGLPYRLRVGVGEARGVVVVVAIIDGHDELSVCRDKKYQVSREFIKKYQVSREFINMIDLFFYFFIIFRLMGKNIA